MMTVAKPPLTKDLDDFAFEWTLINDLAFKAAPAEWVMPKACSPKLIH
jgi:hypothetical protein